MDNNRGAIKLLVRSREDFQAMRKKLDNRIGRCADGSNQNIEERAVTVDDALMFTNIADECRKQEKNIKKQLLNVLKRLPVYTEYLAGIKGVGAIAAGWIIAEFDIEEASTVSKMWQYAGLNPGMVRGKRRQESEDGTVSFQVTDVLVRGDKLTPGFISPFNTKLRSALLGVLADGFIR